MWKRLISASLTFGLAAAAPPAVAQATCGPHAEISQKLTSTYCETVIGRGLQSATSLLEVWRSTENGTWTVLAIRPDGVACIMATGLSWIDERPDPPSGETAFLPSGPAPPGGPVATAAPRRRTVRR